MNLHEKLKSQTAQIHENLERELNLLRSDFTLHHYHFTLKRFYGFYDLFEYSLRKSEYSNFMTNRYKSFLLEQDLNFLGYTNKEISNLPRARIPPLNTDEEILGALYVLEGSTLGSQVLFRHFSEKFSFNPEEGLKFFNCYGSSTGQYWREFLAFLERELQEKKLTDDLIIESAQKTFLLLGNWLTAKEST